MLNNIFMIVCAVVVFGPVTFCIIRDSLKVRKTK